MGSIAYINIAIMILTFFGFVVTTYKDTFAAIPDRIDNPVLATGFGITGLVTTFAVLGAATVLMMNVLFNVLDYLNIW